MAAQSQDELNTIYQELKRGLGHEHVTDANVEGLIQLASRDGHQLLEQELREWRSPCGEEAEQPARQPVMAPTPGFDKTNVKH